MKLQFKVLGLAAVACVAFSSVVQAASITIQNWDFSDPPLANGAFTAYTGGAGVPSWVTHAGDDIGVQNFIGTTDYNSGALPSSPNAVFDDGHEGGGAASLYQNLTGDGLLDNVAAGTYTLSVYGGDRIDKPWVGGSLSLYTAGGTLLGTQALIQPGTDGTFALNTLPVTIAPGNPYIGQQLEVLLTSNGNSTGFDNVALSFAPAEGVPEPSTYAMMLSGLAVLVFLGRRRSICRS